VTPSAPAGTAAPAGLPRLVPERITDHRAHLRHHGPLPAIAKKAGRQAFIAAVERSGLRGRGGGAFPTGAKLRAVADGRRAAIVVANGAEGEPASRKDATLLAAAPHLVLDGALIAAQAIEADEITVVVARANTVGYAAITSALAERALPVRVVTVPDRYVAGEESALVHALNGGESKPIFVPPRPYERGVRNRPTLIQNVETLANLALIARYGDAWYRALGTAEEPGSVLVTVGGSVRSPGVFEFALGTPFPAVLDAAGGASVPLSAVLVGGYFGAWIPAAALPGLMLTHGSLKANGGTLGCGMVAALPAARCGVVESARVARYLAEETAGQCGPCVHGLAAVADLMDSIARERTTPAAHDTLVRWLGDIEHRGACHLPDAAVGFLRSALTVFADEFSNHRDGTCTATDPDPVLPIPSGPTRDWSWQ
jgi:NADH:ubiquinone oxidoreductase subunit F (NADH-binding)